MFIHPPTGSKYVTSISILRTPISFDDGVYISSFERGVEYEA